MYTQVVFAQTVDGTWGQWQSWGVCSVTCGGGRQSRMRVCDDPRPANGGLPCSGSSSEYGYCNIQACPTAAYGAYVQVRFNNLEAIFVNKQYLFSHGFLLSIGNKCNKTEVNVEHC